METAYPSKKKAIVPIVTGICIIVLTILIIKLCKKSSQPEPPAAPQKVEDSRPKLSITGQTAIQHLPTLERLGELYRVYLISQVDSDEAESSIRDSVAPIKTLQEHRVMFSSTEIGYKSLVRQLNPKMHIDNRIDMAREMRGYVNSIAVLTTEQCEFYQLAVFEECDHFIQTILGDIE